MGARRKNALIFAEALLLVALSSLTASGQSLFEPGARAAGMGGAFVALADDTSALFYNPAGLAFLKGVHVKANLLFGVLTTSATWPPTGGTFQSKPLVFRGSLAMSWQFLKGVSLGVGFFTPYHLDDAWPSGWPGNDIDLTARLNPTYFRSVLAVELFKGFSVAAGLDFVSSKLWWTHLIRFPQSPLISKSVFIESRHDLSGKGTGFTAGLLWKAHRALQVGVKYQSRVPLDFSGRNIFITPSVEVMADMIPGPYGRPIRLIEVLNLFYPSQDVTARLTTPKEISAGIKISPFSGLSFLFDAQWNRWSEFGRWEIRSENEGADLSPGFTSLFRGFYGIAPDFGVQSAGLMLKDIWGFKAGVEYRPGTHFALRGGYARHQAPAAAADLNPVGADLNQDIVSIGFGYEGPLYSVFDDRQIGELSFDLFFRYGFSKKGTSALAGHEFIYEADSWVGGVGVGFNF